YPTMVSCSYAAFDQICSALVRIAAKNRNRLSSLSGGSGRGGTKDGGAWTFMAPSEVELGSEEPDVLRSPGSALSARAAYHIVCSRRHPQELQRKRTTTTKTWCHLSQFPCTEIAAPLKDHERALDGGYIMKA